MISTWVFLILVTAQTVRSQSESHLTQLCDGKSCGQHAVRVAILTKEGRTVTCHCVRCVPNGVDKVCQANGNAAMRAVLVGRIKRHQDLVPHACHLENVISKVECPLGSSCIANPKTPGIGVCCYFHSATNRICEGEATDFGECTNCSRRQLCATRLDEFGIAESECRKEKFGTCIKDPTSSCDTTALECMKDRQCGGLRKCCDPGCGKSTCTLNYDPKESESE